MPWNQAPRLLQWLSAKRLASAREAWRSTPRWSKAAVLLSFLLLTAAGVSRGYLQSEAELLADRLRTAQQQLSQEPPPRFVQADFVAALPEASGATIDVAEVQRLVVSAKARVLSMHLRATPPTASTLAVSELALQLGGPYESIRAVMVALSEADTQLLVSKVELRPKSLGDVEAKLVLHRLGQPLKGVGR